MSGASACAILVAKLWYWMINQAHAFVSCESCCQVCLTWSNSTARTARDRIDYVYAQGNPVAETGTSIQGGAYTAIDTKNYALF